jgi:hypothetical protein
MKNYNSYENLLARPNLADEVDTELAERQLLEFVRQAWHVVEPATAFVPNWHLDATCEHLEGVTRGRIPRLVVCMPPRHMKSLLVSVFWPCWEWIRHPERRWLYCSYAGLAGDPRLGEKPTAAGKLVVPAAVGRSLRVNVRPK